MEDALAPAYSVLCHTANKDVLILVVMEDALAPSIVTLKKYTK